MDEPSGYDPKGYKFRVTLHVHVRAQSKMDVQHIMRLLFLTSMHPPDYAIVDIETNGG